MATGKGHDGKELDTGIDVGDTVTYGGKRGTVKQVVIGLDDQVRVLIDVDGDQRQVDAKDVSK